MIKKIILSFFCLGVLAPRYSHAQFKQNDLNRVEELFKSKEKEKYELITYYLINNDYYFSAVLFAKQYLAESHNIPPLFEKALEKIVLKAGTESFSDLNYEILKRHQAPTLKLALGLKYFKEDKYAAAISELQKIPEDHRFYPESLFVTGSALHITRKYSEAQAYYIHCVDAANKFQSQFKQDKLKRYYSIIAENCLIHQARILYREKKYQEAVTAFEKIPKNSYLWPHVLLEKAWSYYKLEDYNRTLGLLVTYKSPLLSSYFFPEGEILNTLAYYRLCLYQDALKVTEQYYQVYRPRSEELKALIDANKNSEDFFFKILFDENNNQKNSFLGKLSTQVKKKVKFNLDLLSYKKAQEELKKIESMKETEFISMLKTELNDSIKVRKTKLNHMAHKYLVQFVNSIYQYSHNMFDIQLDIMSNQRSLIYRNSQLVSDRARGEISNVKQSELQRFWTFKGAFWADELGDYTFGLKSNCEEVKIQKSQQEKEKEDLESGSEQEVEIEVPNPILNKGP